MCGYHNDQKLWRSISNGIPTACVTAVEYHRVMTEKVWTASELAKLTPAQRSQIFQDSIADDLDEVPSKFLDRVTGRLTDHITRVEAAGTT